MNAIATAAGLEFEDRGVGEAVLLIHGAVIADAFRPLSREPVLAGRYRVIWYRRRGYGGSASLPGPFSIADQARDAVALLREREVVSAHVVGHSNGGAIAVRLALDVPELVTSLTLLEPAVFTHSEAAKVKFIEPLREIYRSGQRGKAIHLFMKGAGGADWRADIESHIPGAATQAERDAAGLFEGDLAPILDVTYGPEDAGRIAQPVLYMNGGHSVPPGMEPQGAVVTRLLAPHREEAVVPGVNHSLHMVEPGLVAERLVEFLDRHRMP